MKDVYVNVVTRAAEEEWWVEGADDERWAMALVEPDGTVRLYHEVAGHYTLPLNPPARIVAEARRLAALVRAGTHRVVAGWVSPVAGGVAEREGVVNKLSKEQRKRLDDLRVRWTAAREALVEEQAAANEKLTQIMTTLNEKIADLNALADEANSLREEVEDQAQAYYDEKSEKWQDSDRGSAYSEWLSTWQVEIEPIDEVEIEEIVKADDVPETILSEDEYPTEATS